MNENYFALYLAIVKGLSVNKAFEAIRHPQKTKKLPPKEEIKMTAEQCGVRKTAEKYGISVSTVKRCKKILQFEQLSLFK